jgi:hypothetical protein
MSVGMSLPFGSGQTIVFPEGSRSDEKGCCPLHGTPASNVLGESPLAAPVLRSWQLTMAAGTHNNENSGAYRIMFFLAAGEWLSDCPCLPCPSELKTPP